jgi:acid stress chaperone HdeA
MKFTHLLSLGLAASVAATAGAAAAQTPVKKPLGQWTCEEFLVVEDQSKPKVVYWATAYAKGGKPEASIIDIEGTDKLTPIIVDECRKAPKASFWQKVKAEWRKVESEMKKVEQKAKKTM